MIHSILALDLGTHTGWARLESGRIESGVQSFELKRGESPGMRYLMFNRWLDEMLGIDEYNQIHELVIYESPHQRGGAATEIAAGFSTRVQEGCAKRGINHVALHSASLKKFVAHNGRANKDDMIREVSRRGWTRHKAELLNDDNEADALGLLHYAIENYGSATIEMPK